jgi:uncharacterized membrane protein
MKKFSILVFVLSSYISCLACPLCNQQVRDAIYNSRFYPNLFTMLLAFIVLGIIVISLAIVTNKKHKRFLSLNPVRQLMSPVPLTTASIVSGIGLGGFVDGIVLHQILQAHEMLSNKIASTDYIGKSINMFWDGIFHLFCLMVVIIGIILFWKLLKRDDVDRSGKLFIAGLLFGWGVFNVVEGIIDHQILKLHNVIEFSTNHNMGNYIFLAASVIMLIIGWVLMRMENKKRYAS